MTYLRTPTTAWPTHHYLPLTLCPLSPTLSILLSITAADIASQRADLNDSGGQTNEAKEVSFIVLPFSC